MKVCSKLKIGTCAGIVSLLALISGGYAQATPMAGGNTLVAVTNLFGLTPTLVGTATFGPPIDGSAATVVFPVTGGSDVLIEHEGSGVNLASGDTNATVGNLLIDIGAKTVFGDAKIGFEDLETPDIEDAPLFRFGVRQAIPGGVQLLISDEFGGIIETYFNANPAGEEFGYAFPNQVAVPAPGMVLLILGALGLIGAGGYRRG